MMLLRFTLIVFCVISFRGISKEVITSDSLIKKASAVYQTNPDEAYRLSSDAIVLSKKEGNDANLAKAYEMFGVSLDYLGKLDSAIIYFDKSIEIFSKIKAERELASVYKSKANSLFLLYENNKALIFYLKALEIIKKLKNEKEEASLFMGIGNVYSSMKFYELAIKYYGQSLEMSYHLKDSVYMSYNLTNIAEVYASMNNIAKELEYHRKALAIKEKVGDEYDLVYSYSNMAELLAKFGIIDSALYYGKMAVDLSLKINNAEFLSTSYKAVGRVYDESGNQQKAVEYYQKSLTIARQLKNTKTEYNILDLIAQARIKQGDYKSAVDALNKFIVLNDSINNLETRKSFNELQTQFETEKKEKEISLLNERDKKRQIVIYSIIGLSLLLGLLSFVLFNRFKLKKKVATELEKRNLEISHQKNIIEEKQKEITDSIHYAKRIQGTLLTHADFIREFIPSNFILFKPKDIVSGDFYWAARKDNYFYLAVCDSTGHGVPGAFISLLNIGFLSEAINEKNILEPHLIFNYVRERLVNSISRDGQKDGFDGILLRVNSVTREISYAASNNAPVLISGDQLFELAKDKMPVGQADKMDSFRLFDIRYQKGDLLYLYTDGFADQFGGPKGKKFKYKPLNDTLLSIHQLAMQEQEQYLNTCFEDWKGNLEQVDDVCLLGVKLM